MLNQTTRPAPYDITTNALSLTQAQEMICNWKLISGEIFLGSDKTHVNPEEVPRAFFIPLDDIKNILELSAKHEGKGVRAYIGIDTSDAPFSMKLLMVPCKNGDEDLIETLTGTELSTIYDLVKPCPPLCDSSSPLNNPPCDSEI